MEDLIKILESFNRKERYFLLTRTLAMRSEGNAREFQLDETFRDDLLGKIGLDKSGIKECFVAMDYHLDWIHGSLTLAYPDKAKGKLGNKKGVVSYECNEVTGTQEDIDLLVAFKTEDKYHLTFVEAKGYSAWDTEQLCSKAKRLGTIFGDNGDRYCNEVKPHFVLMSEKPPKTENWRKERQPAYWPIWMRNNEDVRHHLPMCLPAKTDKLRVERCDENGKSWDKGKYFHCPPA